MKLFRQPIDFPDALRNGALTIGNFDGVHRGHARIIQRLKHHATELDSAAIVFTFDPHPVWLLRPHQAPPPLTWINRKTDLLAELGVDVVVAYPTDQQLLELSYREFFQQIVVQQMGAAAMVEGPNFFFGHGRQGNIKSLSQLCAETGICLEVVQPLVADNELISSSRVRELIRQGQVDQAARLLTAAYRIRGMVTHGAARGAGIGFPTANLDAVDTLIPALGVYAGRSYIDHRWHWSAIHIGPNPTFGEQIPKVEVHILDFEGSIYGQVIEVDFIARLRDICQFQSSQHLAEQLSRDIGATRHIARNFSANT